MHKDLQRTPASRAATRAQTRAAINAQAGRPILGARVAAVRSPHRAAMAVPTHRAQPSSVSAARQRTGRQPQAVLEARHHRAPRVRGPARAARRGEDPGRVTEHLPGQARAVRPEPPAVLAQRARANGVDPLGPRAQAVGGHSNRGLRFVGELRHAAAIAQKVPQGAKGA